MLNRLRFFPVVRVLVAALLLVQIAANAAAIDAQLLLKQRLKQLHTFEASFSQVVTDGQNTVLQEAKGKIVLKYPNQLYWRLEQPNENVLVADGNTLWQLDPFMEQVVAVNQSSAVNNNPLILLSNPEGQAWQQFNVTEKDNEFFISPKDPQGDITQLVLTFNDDKLVSLKIIDAQQQVSALTFTDIKQNQKVDDGLFAFKVPAGYELDDQRAK